MVARFCGFYAEAFSEKASGMNDLDIINNAHQLYYKLYKKKFSLEYAWNALRYEPKWLNLEPMNPTPKTTSSNKRKADGAPGTSNDLNVLAQSPVFNDIIYGRAPQMNYYVNGREYNLSYYLTDGIYPEWATFVKSIQRPQHPKHRLFAEHQEGARKDVERAFGVLQSRFAMIKNPCRFLSKGKIAYIMRACLILHNMIVEDERYSYTLYDKEEFEQDEIHTFSVEMPTNLEGLGDGHTRIRDRQAHHQLKEDLIENIWTTFGNE